MNTFQPDPPIRCPHCGRPFANYGWAREHIYSCAVAKQKELDEEWARSQERQANKV